MPPAPELVISESVTFFCRLWQVDMRDSFFFLKVGTSTGWPWLNSLVSFVHAEAFLHSTVTSVLFLCLRSTASLVYCSWGACDYYDFFCAVNLFILFFIILCFLLCHEFISTMSFIVICYIFEMSEQGEIKKMIDDGNCLFRCFAFHHYECQRFNKKVRTETVVQYR